MAYHLGVLDIGLTSELGPRAAHWRRSLHRIWATGNSRTLVVDHSWTVYRIVSWLRAEADARPREQVRIDLMCHGGNAQDPATRRVIAYIAHLGTGIAFNNVHQDWHPMAGKVSKLRLLACGENNPILGTAPHGADREELVYRLARTIEAPVISSPHSAVYAWGAEPAAGMPGSGGVDADGFDGSPVYSYTADLGRPGFERRRRQTLR